MPIGIITNVLAVIVGGFLGSRLGPKLSRAVKDNLNMSFGICAMGMGVSSIVLMKNLTPVILAVVLGTLLGTVLRLGERIRSGGERLGQGIARITGKGADDSPEYRSTLITAIVLFCASGTGIYGSMVAGMTGDNAILLAKSVLDLPTALIFACTLGAVTSVIALPQLIIFLSLFVLARVIGPLCSETMILDFKACGGLLLLATGFRMVRVKELPIADMIPAMALVMPLSALWTSCILPLL